DQDVSCICLERRRARSNAVIEAKFHRSGRERTSTDEHREPTLSRAIHDGLLKVSFDVIRSRVTKERSRAKRTRSRGQVALLRTTTRRRSPPRTCSSRRRRVCDQFTDSLAGYSAWPCSAMQAR